MSLKPSLQAVYKVVDDCVIAADIYLPRPIAGGRHTYPVVLDVHGGAFMLGMASMVSKDQVADCTERGWIVLALEHRLCPQVDMLEGPMEDVRDALTWVQDGGLDRELAKSTGTSMFKTDVSKIVAVGTSSGGHLALSLGFGVKQPVLAILDFYGAKNFSDPFWSQPIDKMATKFPGDVKAAFMNKVFDEKPIPTKGGVSLEGQAPGPPDKSDPRQAYAMTQIAQGTLLRNCFPAMDLKKIDPVMNVTSLFPPTCIVHGDADEMVPIEMSNAMFQRLKEEDIDCDMIKVPGEPHTFVGRMKKGSQTWDLQRKGFDFLQRIIERA